MTTLSQDWNTVNWILTDVDDTLTCDGHLPPETLIALQSLRDAGKKIIAVTGACAGWGDHIAQLWPVDAVLAENGAVIMEKKHGHLLRYGLSSMTDLNESQILLKQQIADILCDYPDLCLTLDQAYRVCEVAIDIGQNRAPVKSSIINEVVAKIHQLGANATASSIHINAWYGKHSKRITAEYYLRQQGLSSEEIQAQCCYVGDSMNDAEMFGWLRYTVGVANIAKVWERLPHKPVVVMSKPGGYGFAEFSHKLLCK
ncbi:HAD-IIB family hydrolase [Vibrio sp. FNV 38]|nr:HAD-IIB family hydrolase [Vibrio sp. FNV 38]